MTFVEYAPDARFPKDRVVGLLLRADDHELSDTLHERVTRSAWMAFGRDPHLFEIDPRQSPNHCNPQLASAKAKNEIAEMLNPIKLGTGWAVATTKQRLFKGRDLIVNKRGGWCPVEGAKIHRRWESDEFDFQPPDDKPTIDPDEHITIMRFGDGTHYYLRGRSGKAHIFSQDKYDTFSEAWDEACRWALEKNIHVEKSKPLPLDGD